MGLSFLSFGIEIEELVELSAVVLVVAPVPVNLAAFLANVERLEHSQRPISDRRFDSLSVLCDLLAGVSRPIPQFLVLGELNLVELVDVFQEAGELVWHSAVAKLQSHHLNFRSNEKLITVAHLVENEI